MSTNDPNQPLSVSAPRESSVAAEPAEGSASGSASGSKPTHGPTHLAQLIRRAESTIARLETQLANERLQADAATRANVELEERLRLGVRMLQAFDVQVERSQKASAGAEHAAARAEEVLKGGSAITESAVSTLAERVAKEKLEWVERELSWRFDRVREVEQRIEEAANRALALLDEEIGRRAGGLAEQVARAEAIAARFEEMSDMTERAGRTASALASLSSESARHLETLTQRTGDAQALREALGMLVHELAAARESAQGDIRRMRDDLAWLVDKGERVTTELVDGADRAATACDAVQAARSGADAVLAEIREWSPLLDGTSQDRVRLVSDAIAAGIRDELAHDMRGFSEALADFAARAQRAFTHERVAHALAPTDTRSIAVDLSRLAPAHVPSIETVPDAVTSFHAAFDAPARAAFVPTALEADEPVPSSSSTPSITPSPVGAVDPS